MTTLPRCETTGIQRLWCMCAHHENGFTMTDAERDLMGKLYNPDEPTPLPTPPRKITIGLDLPADPRRTAADIKQTKPKPKETAADQLHRWLTDLPDDIALLPDVITGNGTATDSRSTPGSRIPLSAGVLDILDQRRKPWHDAPTRCNPEDGQPYDDGLSNPDLPTTTLHELHSWVRIAVEDMTADNANYTAPGFPVTIATECDWLLRHAVWIAEAEWFHELHKDVRRIRRQVKHALGERPEYLPHCDRCGWRLESMDMGAWYQCSGCKRKIDHWAELQRIAELQAPMTIPELSLAVDVPEKTLHDWAGRGLLTSTNQARRGRTYDAWQARQVKAMLTRGPNASAAG